MNDAKIYSYHSPWELGAFYNEEFSREFLWEKKFKLQKDVRILEKFQEKFKIILTLCSNNIVTKISTN